MAERIADQFRRWVLHRLNTRRIARVLREITPDRTPVVFIVTQDIVHLTPWCLQNIAPSFAPVVLLNGVSPEDCDWVRRTVKVPTTVLKASLTGNQQSMLSHGRTLNSLFAAATRDFCIQDPDCFVVDLKFWESVSLSAQDFAGGPFVEHHADRSHLIPSTFFLMFNLTNYRRICGEYDIDADVTRTVSQRVRSRMKLLNYGDNEFPHSFKKYFDTLQAYWVLSFADGLKFREMPGERQAIFHIGGTSYLHRCEIDPAHWDYWPLSVHYFNLCILELPGMERFRQRFAGLYQQHGSASGLLKSQPGFAAGWRRVEIDRIVEAISRTSAD